jgi:hypothetical protein
MHFVQQSSVPANELQIINFPSAEKKCIDAVFIHENFSKATNRRDQIAIAEKHLRGFMDRKCMTFEAIVHSFGITSTIIAKQITLAKNSLSYPARDPCLDIRGIDGSEISCTQESKSTSL